MNIKPARELLRQLLRNRVAVLLGQHRVDPQHVRRVGAARIQLSHFANHQLVHAVEPARFRVDVVV